ncbi:sortilin-related receptor-like [Ruditapes philippinarum]|uniref:sortilin-related receptor-like n=1 Tax=Ruditapes philippinarum TaxID=129788 RepID=UPI00295AF5B3|nr:sortilin-related receptor-like [Ruditapes philippinarum]
MWSLPDNVWSLPNHTPFLGCLLGRKVMIERRVPHSNCYNGKDYNREMTVRNCSCTREDFECDFGYKPNSEYFSVGCIPDPDVDQNIIHRMPSVCPEGTFYPYTRGFAKVSGDTCQGGEEHRYAPLMYACRAQDIEEFLLYSSRREVLQKILSSSQNDVKLLDSTIAKNVSAVDYQLGETGCLYWADNELHKIQRLCEDGNHSVEMLHSGIGEVPSIAYDWKGHNLYWIDRKFPTNGTIEVSKANGIYRRTLINGSYLIKPTSLVIDPHHGWMYWADSGKLMKAYMDGTHSSITTFLSHSTIGSDTVLALDILTERIFWSGAGIRYASLRNPVVTSVGNSLGWFHIDALGIYKEKVYWAEYTMSRLYSCDVSNCVYRYQDINDGIIDLKILDENSQRGGNAACDHNGECTHLCLLKPSTADVHGQNRTCRCPNNATLIRTSTTQEDEHCCQGKAVVNVTSGACVKLKTNCTDNQFLCDNGHCIPNSYMCDRDNDCGDMSDEHDCEFQTCSDGHFTCDNGRCIPEDWICDFDNDCTDNSDEMHCSYPSCPVDKFKCRDGRCINLSWKCDFDDDCPDGLDEENCNYNSTDCGEGQFKCLSGSPRCVPDYQVCDHRNNCADGSDEKNNCSITCPSWKSPCGDGSCVYLSWVCDGDKDCSNGNDEANCTSTVSPVTALPTTSGPCTGFVCDNGICIRNGLRCDGIDDCGDNSDEYRCGTVRPHTCMNNEFHCRNGRCVAHWMRCDSHNDCGDNTDEFNCDFTTSRPIIECAPGQILCYNSSRRCLDESVMCDNFRDCEGGEDEQFCGGVSCDRSLFFKCHSSAACIPKKFLCDEAFNCPDGSDEAACGNQTSGRVRSNITCSAHEFQCMYENKCIPYLFVCDGKPQCAHKSDENLPQCFDSTLADYEINAKMGANNATVEWGPVGVGKNVNYILSYLAYFHQANNWHNTTTLTEPRYTLTKLHSAMTYYITVYATVGSSIHRYKIIQVTTLDDVPDVPRYIGVSSMTSSQTIEVYWGDPQVFKGEILYFEVCIGKTNMTIHYCVQSKKNMYTFDSLENEQPFVNGQKYFVQVSAVDSVGEGAKTEPKNITFGIEGISSYVGDLEGTPVGNTSIKLTWGAPANDGEKINNYVVHYQNLLGNMVTRIVDKKTLSYVVEDLCPGSWYTFSVAPNNKISGTGPGIYISSKTDGAAIGKISNISVEWIAPAVLKVSWPIPDGASPNENYTVYYDYDPDNLHSHKVSQYAKKRIVNTNSTIIDGLRGCELYYFRIAPGNCILSEVKSESTYYDQLAEPEDLAFHPINMSSGNLTWKASCPNGEPTGYIVYRTEVATGKKVVIQPYSNTSKVELFLTYTKLTPGATYKVTIRNTNKAIDGVDPKMSEPMVFNMDPYPSPFNLHVKSASEIGDSGVLVWVKPSDVPKEIFKGYEVLLCSDIHNEYIKNDGKCKNNTDYKHYAYSKNNTASYSGLTVGYHYFKVRLNKIDGYYGNMSENFTVTVLGGVEVVTQASSLQLSQTNLIAICVSVGVVIMALVVIIGCFVVRHRRLQRSFHAYARSHYDSSSGTTTFSAADELEDEDSPMIRGFSDDEPLVIA